MLPDMSNRTVRKRCLDCHYALDFLTENRCPECGREFNNLDPATWWDVVADPPLDRARRQLKLGIALVCLLDVAWYAGIGERFGSMGSALFVLIMGVHAALLMGGIIAAPRRPSRVKKWAVTAIILGLWPLGYLLLMLFLFGIGAASF